MCLSSVFVDKAGEWKLGAVDFMHLNNAPDMPVPAKSLPYLERYSPPEKSTSGAPVKAAEKWYLTHFVCVTFIIKIISFMIVQTNQGHHSLNLFISELFFT